MIKHAIDLSQGELFSMSRNEFLKVVDVDLERLKRWYQYNLLSFNPEELRAFYNKEIMEVKFIKTLVDSGLCFEKIIFMLGKLEKPYVYSFEEIYWDFAEEKWVSLEDLINNYIEKNYQEIINQYTEQCLDDLIEILEDEENYQEVKVFEYGNYLIIKNK